jgi:hypothetical protein
MVSFAFEERGEAYLVVREDQSISNDHILPPACSENDHLRNILGGERLAATGYISIDLEKGARELTRRQHPPLTCRRRI